MDFDARDRRHSPSQTGVLSDALRRRIAASKSMARRRRVGTASSPEGPERSAGGAHRASKDARLSTGYGALDDDDVAGHMQASRCPLVWGFCSQVENWGGELESRGRFGAEAVSSRRQIVSSALGETLFPDRGSPVGISASKRSTAGSASTRERSRRFLPEGS